MAVVFYAIYNTTTGEITKYGRTEESYISGLTEAGEDYLVTSILPVPNTYYVDVSGSPDTLEEKTVGVATVDALYPDVDGTTVATISSIPDNATLEVTVRDGHPTFSEVTLDSPLQFSVNDNVAVILFVAEAIYDVVIKSPSTLDQEMIFNPQYPDDEEVYFQWLGEAGPVGLTFEIVEG